jgi:hypothetical protein
MTTTNHESRHLVMNHSNREVVAGLVNDGSAAPVAIAAVALALSLGCRVRFLQVLEGSPDPEAQADSEAATFQAALQALRGHPRLPSTFEVVYGDPAAVLVARSQHARALVVGEDREDSGAETARYCQTKARCSVQTVPRRA